VREEPQDHLQAAAAGAQQRGFRVGVDVAGGQFRGDGLTGRGSGGQCRAGAGDLVLQVLPGAEDADEGGIRDADVVTRKGPAAGVAAGPWW
jgi:hypothetical protein